MPQNNLIPIAISDSDSLTYSNDGNSTETPSTINSLPYSDSDNDADSEDNSTISAYWSIETIEPEHQPSEVHIAEAVFIGFANNPAPTPSQIPVVSARIITNDDVEEAEEAEEAEEVEDAQVIQTHIESWTDIVCSYDKNKEQSL